MCDDTMKKSMRCEDKFENNNELIPPGWEYEKSVRDYNSDILSHEQQGIQRGMKTLGRLIQLLLKENRKDDIEQVVKDEEYRDALLKTYHLL